MKFDLKETKTTQAETFKHLLTVLDIILQEKEQYLHQQEYNLALVKMQEAEKYLKNYIKELIKQYVQKTS